MLAIAIAATWAASAQERNIPLPGFVLRDASGALVGQILVYPDLVLVSAGGDKAVFEVGIDNGVMFLSGPAVYYPQADCVGAPMISFSEGPRLRGAEYGIGADGVVQKVTAESLVCVSGESASQSGSSDFGIGQCSNVFVMSIEGCRMAEASAIDLSELQEPFHIE